MLIFNQRALDSIVGGLCYLQMAPDLYMETVGYAQEDREQMRTKFVSLAQNLQNFMIGSTWDLWLCFLLYYIGSSSNGTLGKRVPVHFSNTSLLSLSALWLLSSPYS